MAQALLHSRRNRDDGWNDATPAAVASTVCELSGFRISAERRGMAGARGGDFYTLAVHAPGRIGVVVGDACGSGREGEAQLAPLLPALRELALSEMSPANLLTELNRRAAIELPLDRFATAVALELDVDRGTLTVSNAAHVPPLVRRTGTVSVVCRRAGWPLGFSATSQYENEHYDLAEGDVIVLMTDGVLEAIEVDLLAMSTSRRLFAKASRGARGAHRLFRRRFEECTSGRPADDMTLLAVEAMSNGGASNANGFLQVG